MSVISNRKKGFSILKKRIINFALFMASIIGVTAIVIHGAKATRLETSGTLIVVGFCYLVLFLFLMQFRREVLKVSRKILFMLLIIFAFILLSKIVTVKYGKEFIFIIPFAVIPVIIRTFYDSRLALFILLVTIMLSGLMIVQPFEFILMSFISGMVSIFTLTNIYRRTRLFFTSVSVIISLSGLYLGFCLMLDGNLHKYLLSDLLMFCGNGVLVLLSYPLIIVFEQRFLLISETTLLELSDTNQPLLRKLAEEAPGSFQHSLQVANLAEEAARAIGAHLLLVRAGALYHDIGKIANPSYFIENQAEGLSPHENLSPAESGRVIINHVKNGVVLAKNYKLPVQIIDFIRTHHGTTVAYYFYKKYLDQNPGKTAVEEEFAYPGPKPFSKETAVVMMADAVEAASRSLGKYTEEGISELVERILYLQEQDGQYSDVPLTFKDISDIKAVFKKRLLNIYHARIAYPERG
ncbi:MAG: HDIG domain-containing metalloprotein [Bacteroidales bacterium]